MDGYAGSGGGCVATDDDKLTLGMVPATIDGVESFGYRYQPTDEMLPEVGTNVLVNRTTGSCPGLTDTKTLAVHGRNANPQWSVSMSGTALASLDDCSPTSTGSGACDQEEACDGTHNVLFDARPASDECGDLKTTYVSLDVSAKSSASHPSSSDCVAGAGRFRLVPALVLDRDRDALTSAFMWPVQQSGSGVMTRQGSVTSATLVTGVSGKTLRMMKAGQTAHFSASDALDAPANVATAVTGAHSYSAGAIYGYPLFAIEELAPSELDDLTVDLAWSCSTSGSGQARPQGYQFRLSDIGCADVQKFTLRYATAPNRVMLEPYGNPDARLVEPTQTTTEGEAFAFDEFGLQIDGVLLSATANAAVVRLDELTFNGSAVCATGTYTLSPE
jgi:hypothetical protein